MRDVKNGKGTDVTYAKLAKGSSSFSSTISCPTPPTLQVVQAQAYRRQKHKEKSDHNGKVFRARQRTD